MIIKAKFIGQDGSLGYEHGREYEIIVDRNYVNQGYETNDIVIECYAISDSKRKYQSIVTFFNNWDNIRKV